MAIEDVVDCSSLIAIFIYQPVFILGRVSLEFKKEAELILVHWLSEIGSIGRAYGVQEIIEGLELAGEVEEDLWSCKSLDSQGVEPTIEGFIKLVDNKLLFHFLQQLISLFQELEGMPQYQFGLRVFCFRVSFVQYFEHIVR